MVLLIFLLCFVLLFGSVPLHFIALELFFSLLLCIQRILVYLLTTFLLPLSITQLLPLIMAGHQIEKQMNTFQESYCMKMLMNISFP